MVAHVEIVRDRESRIRQYVADLRQMAAITEAAFLENRERQYAVLHALQLAIEASVEIATHICAADNLGIPASYTEAFDLIEQAGIVDEALGKDLRAMARFRNRIVTSTAASTWRACTVWCTNTSPTLIGISSPSSGTLTEPHERFNRRNV